MLINVFFLLKLIAFKAKCLMDGWLYRQRPPNSDQRLYSVGCIAKASFRHKNMLATDVALVSHESNIDDGDTYNKIH